MFPVWTLHGSTSLYQDNGGGGSFSSSTGNYHLSLHRQLAPTGTIFSTPGKSRIPDTAYPVISGTTSQLSQIASETIAAGTVHWGNSGFTSMQGLPPCGQGSDLVVPCDRGAEQRYVHSLSHPTPVGPHVGYHISIATHQATRGLCGCGSCNISIHPSPTLFEGMGLPLMVDGRSQPDSRRTFPPTNPTSHAHHRRFPGGMGGSSQQHLCRTQMGGPHCGQPHQFSGAAGYKTGSELLSAHSPGTMCSHSEGQYYSAQLCQPSGRDGIPESMPSGNTVVRMVYKQQHLPCGHSHSWVL